MKKFTSGMFALFALFGVSADALAATPIAVVIDGNIQKYDVAPAIYDNRTLVPMRGIFESLGATVLWDGTTDTVTATRGASTVKLQLNSLVAYQNGQQVSLDAAPRIVNNRTLVPIRFVGESLGVDVTWDEPGQKVVITTTPAIPSTPPPGQPQQQYIPFPYPINTSLITLSANRSYQKRPETRYLVIHETVSKTTARGQLAYFNSQAAYANAHVFIDWNEVLLTLPPDELAWSVGKPANSFTFNIEMCHAKNATDFAKEWDMTVSYAAKWCMDTSRDPLAVIRSHHEISTTIGGTDHTDPDDYFKEFGKTMDNFRQDVVSKIEDLKKQNQRWS